MKQIEPRPNYLGIKGWAGGGRYGLERSLYFWHRVTGLWLLLFVLIHLSAIIVFRTNGQDIFAGSLLLLRYSWFKVITFSAVAAAVYHGLNGIRLGAQELGFVMGSPSSPIFPYRDAMRKKRPFTIVLMVIAGVITVIFLVSFVMFPVFFTM